ncbi:MAG: hypothetical protein HOK54_04330 [Alphaproteobacteria bacterium]|jgi:hypothetical protein|nr:hypothetical protein [Alphaproteobacteria bacterium]
MNAQATAMPAARLLPAYTVAAVVVLIWDATPAAAKVAVGGLDPILVDILRTVLAAAVVVSAAMLMRLPLPAGLGDWGQGYPI